MIRGSSQTSAVTSRAWSGLARGGSWGKSDVTIAEDLPSPVAGDDVRRARRRARSPRPQTNFSIARSAAPDARLCRAVRSVLERRSEVGDDERGCAIERYEVALRAILSAKDRPNS